MFAWHGFADAAHAGSDRANADCLLVEPGDFEPCSNGRTPVPSSSSATATRRDPLHLRDHRDAQGAQLTTTTLGATSRSRSACSGSATTP